MSDEPDEKEKGMEAVPEDAPEKEAESHVEDVVPDTPEEEPDEDDAALSVDEIRAEAKEIGTRFRDAGLRPFWRMARSYANTLVDAFDGLAEALEGNKRKKGD